MTEQTEVTKEMLESYRSKKEEIKELQYKLRHLGEGDSMVGNDTIFDYRNGYPQPQAVVGTDWEKISRTEQRYRNKISELESECQMVEDFVEGIKDSMTRRIFRMYYIEGMSQKAIGKKVHMDRSRISRKIDDYLKNAHKAHKAHL